MRRLTYGLTALLLVVSIGAGAGEKPIRLGSARTQAQKKTNEGAAQTSHTGAWKAFQVGAASWYGEQHDGKATASGERFDMYGCTAAHPTLRLGTLVRVTNLDNRRTVLVRINDRGPFVSGRIIDVSYNAARLLDFVKKGVQRVRLDVEEHPAAKLLARNYQMTVPPAGRRRTTESEAICDTSMYPVREVAAH